MFKRLRTLLLPVAILAAVLGGVSANAATLPETRVGGYQLFDAASRQTETPQVPESQQATGFSWYDTASECSDAAKSTEDILVLGRGPLSRLENLAGQQGGRVSTINSTVPKEIFKQNYRDIRSADKIIQYMDNIPTTLEESLQIGGQYSRAEVYMINQRKDLLEKTIRLYENAPAGR